MFFALSKLFALVLKPLTLLVLLGFYGLFTKNAKRKRRSFRIFVAGLALFTNPWLVNQFARAWESGGQSPDQIVAPYDVGILLGGYTQTTSDIPPGTWSFFRSDRLTSTLALYKSGKIRHILLSGGSGKLISNEMPEARTVRDYLLRVGVPDSVILIDDRSRNTRENAVFSKALVDSLLPGARCLLITSAWHLPRALPCFEKAGLPCDPFGTDYMTEKNNGNPFNWIEPDWKALMKWDALGKEWVGWLVYRAKGYI